MFATLNVMSQSEPYAVSEIPQELKKNANAVVRSYDVTVDLSSTNKMVVKTKRVITVLNKQGNRNINASERYDNNSKIRDIRAIVYDKFGKEIKKINVRLVQANISNFLKIDSEKGTYASTRQVIERYQNLSLQESGLKDPIDLIIWPETAYPFSLRSNPENLTNTALPLVFTHVTKMSKADLFTGGYDSQNTLKNDAYFKTEHNTAFHISKEGTLKETYNKRELIPFGETLPFGFFNQYISRYIDNISFFKEGEKFTLFTLNNGMHFFSTICYELLKPTFVREYLNQLKLRPHFMINLTNDSWYGKTMEPHQHLFLAKWRALEFNMPIIRSTNTGISSVIYADGTESKRLGVYKTGNLDLELLFSQNKATTYQKFGILPLFALWILYFIFHLLGIKLKNE